MDGYDIDLRSGSLDDISQKPLGVNLSRGDSLMPSPSVRKYARNVYAEASKLAETLGIVLKTFARRVLYTYNQPCNTIKHVR